MVWMRYSVIFFSSFINITEFICTSESALRLDRAVAGFHLTTRLGNTTSWGRTAYCVKSQVRVYSYFSRTSSNHAYCLSFVSTAKSSP
eukprot:6143019-Heterocapsa_arctica.AAC.1